MGRGSSKREGNRPTANSISNVDYTRLQATANASVAWRSYRYNHPEDVFGGPDYRVNGESFDIVATEVLQKTAASSGIAKDFNFDMVQGSSYKSGKSNFVEIKADEFAFSDNSKADSSRRWFVNVYNTKFKSDGIKEQKRFSTPKSALQYAAKNAR